MGVIHYKAESTAPRTACGCYYGPYSYVNIDKEEVTLDGAKVTCKNCLRSLDFRKSSRPGVTNEMV